MGLIVLPALPAVQAAIEGVTEIVTSHADIGMLALTAVIIRALPAISHELRAWVRLMRR